MGDLFAFLILIALCGAGLYYTFAVWLPKRQARVLAEREEAERHAERQKVIDTLRQKQASGVIATGLYESAYDRDGNQNPSAYVAEKYMGYREQYSDNPQALALETTRFIQSLLQTMLVLPDPDNIFDTEELTVEELVRHLLGTWGIDPKFYVGRFLHKVNLDGRLLEERVEVTPELLFRAGKKNEQKIPFRGKVVHRKVHAANMKEEMDRLRQRETTSHGGLPAIVPKNGRATTDSFEAVPSSGLELDTESDWLSRQTEH